MNQKATWKKTLIISILFFSLSGLALFVGLYLKKDIVMLVVVGSIIIAWYAKREIG